MDWAEKYRPQSLQDIVGNGSAVRQVAEWAREWTPASRPLILYGKPGTGKTSTALALAHDMNWDEVELNASDQRTKAVIEKIVGSTSTTASLTGAHQKLIILDEADNLHGTADRGGARAIIDLIKTSRQPIILIANDIYGLPKELKAVCDLVQFRAISARSIVPRLRYICARENLACSEDALASIGESASGDLRAAINMLYAAGIGKGDLNVENVHTSQKDERATIFELVGGLFKGKNDVDLMRLSAEVSDTPDTVEQWIGANLHHIDDPVARSRAHQHVAHADEFIGYTFRRQYYMLWRYANALMLLGTAAAAKGSGLKGRILPPSRWRRMGEAKRQKAIRNAIMNKFERKTHIPQKTFQEDYLIPITRLIEQDPVPFVEEFDLDKDELNYFLHDKTRSAKVLKDIKKLKKESEKALKANNTPPKQEKEDEPAENRPSRPSHTQSTLFDGF